MPRMDKLSTYRTTWEQEGARGSVTYVKTRIVAWDGDIITLNSGGWQTVTTKRKMVQASRQFDLRFSVYQKGGEWFVDVMNPRYDPTDYFETCGGYWKGLAIPFRDGMRFNKWTGEVIA